MARNGQHPLSPAHLERELRFRLPRPRSGTPTIPDSLLLRDALYLLQGINGRFVTFHEPKIQHNPYLQPPEGEEPLDTLQLVFAEDDEVCLASCIRRFHLPSDHGS